MPCSQHSTCPRSRAPLKKNNAKSLLHTRYDTSAESDLQIPDFRFFFVAKPYM